MRYFASNFAPRYWALCAGQLLSISTNSALFSLLGTTYGGDGRSSFGLPDARGRFIVSPGQGPGLSNYALGQMGGTQGITLTLQNLPSHDHPVVGSKISGNMTPKGTSDTSTNNPNGMNFATGDGVNPYTQSGTPDVSLAPVAVSNASASITIGISGGSQPLSVQGPFLGLNVIICLQGIFPSRN